MMSLILPRVNLVIDDMCKEIERRIDTICSDINCFKELLSPLENQIKYLQSSKTTVPPLLRSQSLISPLSQKQNIYSPKSTIAGGKLSKSQRMFSTDTFKEQQCPPVFRSKIDDILVKGIEKNLKEFIQNVGDYIDLRDNRNKRTEVARQALLLDIEKMWGCELETFQIFEPDLAESFFKSMSRLEKNYEKTTPIADTSLKRIIHERVHISNTQDVFEGLQALINHALCKDLQAIDFEDLRTEEDKAVGLHTTVTALRDIRKFKSDIIFMRESWQNIETSELE